VMRLGTISEKTSSSRTRRAISWAYWAPKSTTSTAPPGSHGRSPAGVVSEDSDDVKTSIVLCAGRTGT